MSNFNFSDIILFGIVIIPLFIAILDDIRKDKER